MSASASNPTESKSELMVRPKVMRRPAQFSVVEKLPPIPPAPLMLVPHNAPAIIAAPQARPWQDDGRFALVLLGLIIFMNLAVIAWLSALAPTQTPDSSTVHSRTSLLDSNQVYVLDSLASKR